jgi:3-methyladenine DNA glycosylase AlkD
MGQLITAFRRELAKAGDPAKAVFLLRFFKTGPGQYGEGDLFRGITVPVLRAIARRYQDLPWGAISDLLRSPYHEDRLAALMVLVFRVAEAAPAVKDRALAFYLARTRWINNWDLVDLSAPQIVGQRLVEKRDPALLFALAQSPMLWKRRIAIVGSYAFIRSGATEVTLGLAEKLLGDKQDLMHKATGWMLREAGKRDLPGLTDFLGRHAGAMPRTMLRYAIEKLPPEERKRWMAVC